MEQPEKASQILDWVESLADSDGFLPEQVNTAMLHPDNYAPWVEQGGTIANLLLWTHAMYIILGAQMLILKRPDVFLHLPVANARVLSRDALGSGSLPENSGRPPL